MPRTYVVSDLKNEEIFGTFYEKELQKENQSLELKKSSREKTIKYVLSGKATIIFLTVGLIKRYSYIKRVIFQNHIPIAKTKEKLS